MKIKLILVVNLLVFGYFIFLLNFGQVERVFGTNHPEPVEVEKAKKVLKVCRERNNVPFFPLKCL